MKIIIGEKIKQYRKSHKLSQESFAKSLNISKQTVSKWEKETCFPDIILLPEIAKLLNCKIDDFFIE